jgi:hypothetical protein
MFSLTHVSVVGVFVGVVAGVPLVGAAVFADFDHDGLVEVKIGGCAGHFGYHSSMIFKLVLI